MTREELLAELTEILQRDESLTGEEILENLEEWDSMANLGVISMLDLDFGISMSIDELRQIKSVDELINFALSNKQA